jgi:2-(1,2-epoxy-1,2-dihydrophenyl)acetyl-CoA isomerase
MAELEISDQEGVRRIVIARPEAGNSLNIPVLRELTAAIAETAAAPELRALLITGKGRIFCAGGDLKEWRESKASGRNPGPLWGETAKQVILGLVGLKKPVVAAINGAAAGAGLDLACACDFRLAATTARFICSYTRVGFAPDQGGTWFLPRLIGLERALRLVATGDAWSAAEALAAGLVGEVHEPERLPEAAEAFARKLAQGPTVAIGLAKRLLYESDGQSLAAQIDREHAAAAICRETADHREGLAAAGERRTPHFIGR